MSVVIDTSSLLSLVRYYLPFDNEGKLKALVQQKIETGEMIVLDKVAEECTYVAKGVVIEQLPFIADKCYQVSTSDLFPPKAWIFR